MSQYLVEGDDLTYLANKIRTKGGTSAQLSFPTGMGDAVDAIPSSNWTLIGTKVFENVPEYTDTENWDTDRDTEINIKNTDYAVILTVITCDSPITTSTEWGNTIALGGRYTSNSNYFNGVNTSQKGSSTLSKSAMVNGTVSWNAYGVTLYNNTDTIKFSRKCHGTGCPKIRAGNYTVKVYGMTAF